jgi:hypothetical protein
MRLEADPPDFAPPSRPVPKDAVLLSSRRTFWREGGLSEYPLSTLLRHSDRPQEMAALQPVEKGSRRSTVGLSGSPSRGS